MKDQTTTSDTTMIPYVSNPLTLLKLSIKAFSLMAMELLKLIGVGIIALFIAAVPAIIGLASMHNSKPSVAGIGLIVVSVVLLVLFQIYFTYPVLKLNIAAARGVALPWKETLPPDFAVAANVFGTAVLASIIILFGFLLFIVPGIFFLLWYSQAQYIAVDEKVYGMKALVRSKDLVHHRLTDILGVYGLSNLVQLISYIPVLGSLVSLAFGFIAMPMAAIRYVQLTQLPEKDRSKTPTNKWNYILFWVTLLPLAIIMTLSIASSISHKKAGARLTIVQTIQELRISRA